MKSDAVTKWAIYAKHGKRWVPLFKNNKAFRSKSYAQKILRDQNEWSRIINRRLDLKLKALSFECCKFCGSELGTQKKPISSEESKEEL